MRPEGIAIALAMTLLASSASSEDTSLQSCIARAHAATYPILHCLAGEMTARNQALSAAYQSKLDATTDLKTRRFLIQSQQNWIQYRDNWCEADVSRSGSMARIKLLQCRIDETARRVAELRSVIP